MSTITLDPIGIVRSTRAVVTDDDWDREEVSIELDAGVDLKPWVAALGPRGPVTEPAWMAQLMRGYWS